MLCALALEEGHLCKEELLWASNSLCLRTFTEIQLWASVGNTFSPKGNISVVSHCICYRTHDEIVLLQLCPYTQFYNFLLCLPLFHTEIRIRPAPTIFHIKYQKTCEDRIFKKWGNAAGDALRFLNFFILDP